MWHKLLLYWVFRTGSKSVSNYAVKNIEGTKLKYKEMDGKKDVGQCNSVT